MRTLEVVREFRDHCKVLAEASKIPEVKVRLHMLAHKYDLQVEELERVESESIAPR